MAIQLSIYNLRTKKKEICYFYDEQKIDEIIIAQKRLTTQINFKAFEIVLTELVETD